MGLISLQKLGFFVLIISASLVPAMLAAGRPSKLVIKSAVGAGKVSEVPSEGEMETALHDQRRLLRMNDHDYGTYDPSPTLAKPRFKLIPN
ncbi:hypothetical protein Dimus_025539 [Dionaea muscipula]